MPSRSEDGLALEGYVMADHGDKDSKNIVIVVDDDPAVCGSLEFSLQTEGFCVKTYAGGPELLAEPELPTRGCIILDYYLPGMNGLEVAIALRKRRVALPIILITTHPTRSLRQSAAAEGIDIIEKPLLGNALSEGIRAAFRNPRPPRR
jgi:two-component system, LuxR family, response regulator FixJ